MCVSFEESAISRVYASLNWIILIHFLLQAITAKANEESVENQTGWIPSMIYPNITPAWYPSTNSNNGSGVNFAKTKLPSGRAFQDNRIDTGTFDYAEFADPGDNYKAVPVPFSPNEPQTAPPASAHFHTILKPGSAASSSFTSFPGLASSNLQPFSQSYPYSTSSGGYHYPAPHYLPLPPPPSQHYLPQIQNIETFDHHHQTFPVFDNITNSQLQINTKNKLIIQPGKCSNSIEIGRVRDVEVRTVLKQGTDSQKGVCVLMLYAASELNKLAISLQAEHGTTNIIQTGTWLETNVKMYAMQAGDIQPIFTKSNFGANTPALILTRSNIVILSFYVDRPIDFFLDILTYQSLTC